MDRREKIQEARRLRQLGNSKYKIAQLLKSQIPTVTKWTQDIILSDKDKNYADRSVKKIYCKLCGIEIPKTMNGKRVYVTRKYCFKCIKPTQINQNTKRCYFCKKDLSIEAFYKKGTKLSSFCRECFNFYTVERQKERKKQAVKYKGSSCVKCGYNKCLSALCFHHRDPKQKEIGIHNIRSGFEKMKKELDKCDLLCHNCHAEIHEEIRNLSAPVAQLDS